MTSADDIPGFYAPVHRALAEPILLGGAPRALAIVNGTLAGAIGLGLRLWLAGLAIWAIGHVLSVWAARRDPQFVDVARGDLDLGKLEAEEDKQEQEKAAQEKADLVKRIQEVLKDDLQEVRVSHRLTDSPACLVADEHGMSAHLERILKEAGQEMPNTAPHLEINPTHPLVEKLASEQGEDEFEAFSQLLFEQAVLAEGGELDDPATFVRRMNQMLLAVSKGAAA